MTMEKLKKCRICLVENVRMFVVANKNLREIYEKLTDVPFVTEDSRPMLACFFCCSKLKQCYRLQRKCLEAEDLFAQMLNDDYVTTPLINHGLLEFFSGFNITPTVHISIVDKFQTESIAIKEELPAVCEGIYDIIIEPKKEHQSNELELEKFNNSYLDVADIPPHHSESDLENDVFLMELKTEVEEQAVSKNKQRARETIKNRSIVNAVQTESIAIKEELPVVCEGLDDIIEPKEEHQSDELEPDNFDNSYQDVADIPPHQSENLEDDVPLLELKTEVEEQAVSKDKRRAREATRATVAKKPKLDTRKTELEDAITAEQTKKDRPDSKVIQITQKRTSKPGTYFKEPYKCDQRSFNQVKKKIQHTRTRIGEKPHKCDVCQRSFSKKSDLTNHIRIHTGEKPFKCVICQCCFRQYGALKTHISQHTGEKPYKCEVCQRNFSQKGNLKNHIRIHTGEKPFKCDICQCSFRQSGNLKTHIRQHTGEKPYNCDVCQRSFSEKGHLSRHIRIHTGEKPYKCDICQRSFREKRALTKHIRIHTGEKSF